MINHRVGFGTNWMVLFAPLMATVAVSAQAAQSGFQFDLICQVHGRKVIDYAADLNQSEGDNGPWDWHDRFRYAIDLKSQRYRGLDWVNQAPEKIVRVTKARFWLSEDKDGFERYNLNTNRYYARAHGATFIIHIATGTCRRAPFSGFPVLPRTVGNK
jgi:hypothetical protein